MFIRYEVMQGLTNNTTSAQSIMQDIYGALTGTITNTTNFDPVYCNRALSTIDGSIHDVLADDNSTNVYYNWGISNGRITFNKRHHNYGVTTNGVTQDAHTENIFAWNYNSDYPKWRTRNGSSSYFPYNNNSTSHYWVNNSSTYQAAFYPSQINRINIFASKYWFFVQFQESSTNNLSLGGTLDYEMDAQNAWALHASGANFGPQFALHSCMVNSQDGGTGTSNDWFSIGYDDIPTHDQENYPNGNYTGSILQNGSGTYSMGYNTRHSREMCLFPFPMNEIYQTKINAVNSLVNPLYPVHVIGSGYSAAPLINAKVPYLYRTTDQIAPNIDTVTVNSADYRVLRMHKTHYNIRSASNYRTACYLLPETIGGY